MVSDGLRADAARNVERIVAAGRAALREDGANVAFTAIGRRAGVGQATLYRHFPSREALMRELVERDVARLRQVLDEEGYAAAVPGVRVLTVVAEQLADTGELTALMAAEAGEPWFERCVADVLSSIGDALDAPVAGSGERGPPSRRDPDELRLLLEMLAAAARGPTLAAARERGRRAARLLAPGLVRTGGTPGAAQPGR